LIAGLAFAGLYGFNGYLLKNNRDYGIESTIATSTLLVGAMLPRAIRTRKPLPIGLASLGGLALAYYIRKWSEFAYGT